MAENKDYITRTDEKGSVNISEDVIATIAGTAVTEVEGVDGFATTLGGDLVDLFGKKNAGRGIKITIEEEEITIDTLILVQYGTVIADVAQAVQEAVASNVESMTGIKVKTVNVSVCGIAFEKVK